ncbi:hypothetical protein AMATHDRAFT_42594 [Amanita thiersii Skay4041]|uniref:SUN domain-containing protein n=1 Tax=Amanita thiersii Skay4041 TaxID=703135 RepID=A0A2A9NAB5_9AGAR|nr:hypothetical protein AMATHDRAFT_42594 [Amanita thiersii Skay4041]
MSFAGTPLGQGRRLDYNTFIGKKQPPRTRSPGPDPPRLIPAHRQVANNTAAQRNPPPPSSDDDFRPALARFNLVKRGEQPNPLATAATTATKKPNIFTTQPNPEKWSVKDTSVNVATAFSQAAVSLVPDIIDMQSSTNPNYAWASNSTRTTVPRSTSVEYEKETQSTSLRNRLAPPPSRFAAATAAGQQRNAPGSRRPVSKAASLLHVPDSEGEGENDISGRAKSPFDQVIDVAKRALAPATFYLRQRSQEPEGTAAPDKSHESTANGKDASYDYSAEEREFQANRLSNRPPNSSGITHRKNRMSTDNKAYKPSLSDNDNSEYSSEDDGKGRRRRRKKKKNEPLGGPLTTLPVMAADKKKKRKSRGNRETGGDDDEASDSDDGATSTPEKQSNQARASVARSIPPLSRSSVQRTSVPPEPYSNHPSLSDAEQGLQSIPEVDVEDDQIMASNEAESYQMHQKQSPPSRPFSIGGFLGRIVHWFITSFLSIIYLIVQLLSGCLFVFGRILGTIVEVIFLRPLRVLGLTGSAQTQPPESTRRRPIVSYILIALPILAAWFALQGTSLSSLPTSFPLPFFSGKGRTKPGRVYVPPEEAPANFAEFAARLQAIENAMSELSQSTGDREISHNDLLGRLDDLSERVLYEARERRRVLESVDGRVRDGVEGVVRRVEETMEKQVEGVERRVGKKVEESMQNSAKEFDKRLDRKVEGALGSEIGGVKKEMEVLKAKLASGMGRKDGSGSDAEARAKLRILEERLGEMEDGVKEAIELGKKAGSAVPSVPSSSLPWWLKIAPSKATSSGIVIKSSDGQDITELLDQMVTSSVLTHVGKDILGKPDYALFSGGARVIPSLTSATLEFTRPRTLVGWVTGFLSNTGYAIGRPPVTALHHEVQNGMCWPFAGGSGQLGVALAKPVVVESVTVDHVPKEVAYDLNSAPKEMEVWALVEGAENVRKWREVKEMREEERRVRAESDQDAVVEDEPEYPPILPKGPEYIRIANFTYDIGAGIHVQNFPVAEDVKGLGMDFGVVLLVVKSNWGREYTCLYRFRVHGQPLEVVNDSEVPVAESEGEDEAR